MMVLKTGLKAVEFYAGHDHVNRHWDVLGHDRLSYIIVTTLHSSLSFSQAQLPRTVLATALALGHVGKRWESMGKAFACRWEGRGRGQALLSDITTTNTGTSMQTRARNITSPSYLWSYVSSYTPQSVLSWLFSLFSNICFISPDFIYVNTALATE